MARGANVDAKDAHGCTALMRSGEQGWSDKIINFPPCKIKKKSILILGHEEMAKLLISHGANVDIVDNYQTNAAGWARSRGEISMNKAMITCPSIRLIDFFR